MTTINDILTSPLKEVEFLVDGLIPKGIIGTIYGSSDVGKSTFLRQLAIAVSEGDTSFLNNKLNTVYQKAILLSTEDEVEHLTPITQEQFANMYGKTISSNNSLKFFFDVEGFQKHLEDEIKVSGNYDIIIIDALGDYFEGDLNNVTNVRKQMNKLKVLGKKLNATVLLLHHVTKSSEGLGASKLNLSGSHGIEAKSRMALELRLDKSDENGVLLNITKCNFLTRKQKENQIRLIRDKSVFKYAGAKAVVQSTERVTKAQDPKNIKKIEDALKENSKATIQELTEKFKGVMGKDVIREIKQNLESAD